jgi:hypothetical protein
MIGAEAPVAGVEHACFGRRQRIVERHGS